MANESIVKHILSEAHTHGFHCELIFLAFTNLKKSSQYIDFVIK